MSRSLLAARRRLPDICLDNGHGDILPILIDFGLHVEIDMLMKDATLKNCDLHVAMLFEELVDPSAHRRVRGGTVIETAISKGKNGQFFVSLKDVLDAAKAGPSAVGCADGNDHPSKARGCLFELAR